jgi:hypothetical protein
VPRRPAHSLGRRCRPDLKAPPRRRDRQRHLVARVGTGEEEEEEEYVAKPKKNEDFQAGPGGESRAVAYGQHSARRDRPRQPGNKASDRGLSYVNGGGNPMSVADGWLLAAFAAAMSLNGFLGYMLYLTF